MASPRVIYQVAVPSPLFRLFDYLPPAGFTDDIGPGTRVRVPFGRGKHVIGFVIGIVAQSDLPLARLKHIDAILDAKAVLPRDLLGMLIWAADYYHHPIGEVLATAVPAWLHRERKERARDIERWCTTDAGMKFDLDQLKRSPVQRKLLASLRESQGGLESSTLAELSVRWRLAIKALESNGLVARAEQKTVPNEARIEPSTTTRPALNAAQDTAVTEITRALGSYQSFLLHGITGSGKTEVYLGAIEAALARERQVLVLVPEIGLTPQAVSRFQRRLGFAPVTLHSGLTDAQRFRAWSAAASGEARLVIGTRSAVFTPMPGLGLIVVDEEHDPSYKQQDGFRYSARDLAVLRAARERIPIVLGSATPSLETARHAREGNYRLLELPERAGIAELPPIRILDVKRLPLDEGLSPPLRSAIAARLARQEQSLLFLNRRGYAPVLMCHDCGWLIPCPRCDSRQTLHRSAQKLVCHHCGSEQPVPERCPKCAGATLRPVGEGTERLESALARYFPHARLTRIDRDSTGKRGALEEKLAAIHDGRADILIGTQMLAKGHDFPNVTLVAVVSADQGLYSADFRAPERLFQLIVQVAGRAGRATKPGEVLIQTHHPDHPIFGALVGHDFNTFVESALAERKETGLPPYGYLAVLRAESPVSGAALAFLRAACAEAAPPADVTLSAPAPAPMERRAGRWRAQVMVQSQERGPLHAFLRRWVPLLVDAKGARRVRWSLDVDPADLY